MSSVASFKSATLLETDKKVNLIYGLNGTGKSTISNFLYGPEDPAYARCNITSSDSSPILVYNQTFIREHFFIADSLKGIFSLSKENKTAEQAIANATKKRHELEQRLQAKLRDRKETEQSFYAQKQQAVERAWSIKQTYAGGDRVLEYCLEGLKGQKEKLFAHLQGISKSATEPKRNIQSIRQDVEALKGEDAQSQDSLAPLTFNAHTLESSQLFGKSILGNSDSEVAELIEKLGNADWVKHGLSYLPESIGDSKSICPFCQDKTISKEFISHVRSYFDSSYQQKIAEIEQILQEYRTSIDSLPALTSFADHPFAKDYKQSIASKYQLLIESTQNNIRKIEDKLKNPKTLVALSPTIGPLNDLNSEISLVNARINEHNERLNNRESALNALAMEFWQLMRWEYDQTVERFEVDQREANEQIKKIDADIQSLNASIANAETEIAEAQKKTVNVDLAVNAINAGLLDLGIDDFCVRKHSDNLYRVVRAGESNDVFRSLSEGEKTMISFLYFCELCKGKASAEDTHTQRIVVIDDPISSLSHVFVFSVGQLIRSIFFKGERFTQVIILTHSLYFFYELTDPNHDRREKTQKLFRLSKPSTGSAIQVMKYEEVQNDYQAYWSVINDRNQPPALIANCMRNIVEYFFNFVRKKDLNNVFQMPELEDTKYQAFCRYINRESHSLGQNIIDMKEFNFDVFRQGLRLVFEKAGYPDHYEAMSKC